ncbi:hypothetical protein IEO70_19640 [Bacillus sp. AGMB 02131]|uniref:Uncharacterized protein n=1 Tax=Peribacillus faecalis TaxID=2772559 RepID=A0A927HCZ2_9BACI|nr:hypothetical protein [Peribacillus faecalis]MBD3110544.1 hypothetical protein [Peribacillus faecalis]
MELSANDEDSISESATDGQFECLQSQLSTSAAQAVVMQNDMQAAQPQAAPHPYAGNIIDLKT